MGKPGTDYWGTIGGGILGVLTHSFARDNLVTSAPFLDPVSSYGTSSAEISDAWFYMGGGPMTPFVMGCVLG